MSLGLREGDRVVINGRTAIVVVPGHPMNPHMVGVRWPEESSTTYYDRADCERIPDAADRPGYDTSSYTRGWLAGQRGVTGALERADARNEPSQWYDGYLDAAAGRERGHLRRCAAHHNGPGGCGEA